MNRLPLLLAPLLLAGCGSPPTGDAPNTENARPASSLPQTPARKELESLRPEGAKGGRHP